MKIKISFLLVILFFVTGCNKNTSEQSSDKETSGSIPTKEKKLFIDVHDMGPGKVTVADVAEAHEKDLKTQGKYDVSFIKYWVDEKLGKIYCLSEAADSEMIYNTHKEAHGLVPEKIYMVSDGPEASLTGKQLFLDIHRLSPGNVTAQAVAEAHEKDLATQEKYSVNFINYWVDENAGVVMCLSEAPDSSAVVKTHTEAHGLVPETVEAVKQGE